MEFTLIMIISICLFSKLQKVHISKMSIEFFTEQFFNLMDPRQFHDASLKFVNKDKFMKYYLPFYIIIDSL